MLDGKSRRHALSLTFTPQEEVQKFVFKLRDKIKEKEGSTSSVSTAAAVQRQDATIVVAFPFISVKEKTSLKCSYSKRSGDNFNKCLFVCFCGKGAQKV